ncbi:MAG: amidohydrolase [Actinobacteria bacterium]|nr:amidohydrolase [Actinomycetota bacterium]
MADEMILRASTVITMDESLPRAQAITIDTSSGVITDVGDLADCRHRHPHAEVTDLGDTVLMPGLIQPHDHPIPAAQLTQLPTQWIAPFVGFPTWDDVEALFVKLQRSDPAGQPLMFNGLDRLLLQCPEPTRASLDRFFPDRAVVIFDITGHALYFNTQATVLFGWESARPPADRPDARWGRLPDGSSNGVGYETAATMLGLTAFAPATIADPLLSLAQWYATLARNGFTAAGDMAGVKQFMPLMSELAGLSHCPIRYSMYQPTYDTGAHAAPEIPVEQEPFLRKTGVKIWMDGSPSIATAAVSAPYLDSPQAEIADIPTGRAPGMSALNYSPKEYVELLNRFAGEGWQIATHINGDVGIGVVLDGYQEALEGAGLTASDHRWRLEHFSIPSREQCLRAGTLGITVSMSPFQSLYWGDLYDGVLFEPSFGARWQPYRDAFDGGLRPTFHNDGYLSPPLPWLNIQNAVTRRSASGELHGPEQAVTLQEALAAHTINAAWQQKRDDELGSITVGKLADLVELSADPFTVAPESLADTITTRGTWIAGRRSDLAAFVSEAETLAGSRGVRAHVKHLHC